MAISLKNATYGTVKHIGDRLNKYDVIALVTLVLVAVGLFNDWSVLTNVATGGFLYAVLGTFAKGIRPDITVLIADRQIKVVDDNDDC